MPDKNDERIKFLMFETLQLRMWLNILTMTAPAETTKKLKSMDRAALMQKSRDQVLDGLRRIGKSAPRELVAFLDSLVILEKSSPTKN